MIFKGIVKFVKNNPERLNLVIMAALLATPILGIQTRFCHFTSRDRLEPQLFSIKSQPSPLMGQDDDDDANPNTVPPADVQKYISVYKTMDGNRSLTVEQAAAEKGLTIEQFRQLEDRIQRDDTAMEQVREQLQAAAKGSFKTNPVP